MPRAGWLRFWRARGSEPDPAAAGSRQSPGVGESCDRTPFDNAPFDRAQGAQDAQGRQGKPHGSAPAGPAQAQRVAAAAGGALAQLAERIARHTRAGFVALGAPSAVHARAAQPEWRFEVLYGPPELADLLHEPPIVSACQAAASQRRSVLGDLEKDACARLSRPISALPVVSRVAALPLEIEGKVASVLLVGFDSRAKPAELERLLEPCRKLVADALRAGRAQSALKPAAPSDSACLAPQERDGSSQELNRTEAELLGVLDSIDSGVLLLDTEGHIRFANARFAQLMGLDSGRLAHGSFVGLRASGGLTEFDALLEAVRDRFREPASAVARWREMHARGGEVTWDEIELVRPTRKVVERFARPLLDSQGKRIGWLEVYRDITGQRLIQSKLLQTEKMAALGQLVSGIAHELNNPLTSIMGYAQLLLGRFRDAGRPEVAQDAQKIYQEAERAGRIVKNLLLFARETKPERKPVDLNEITERTLALRSYELKVENIGVELELHPELPHTLADAPQLQQVVLNLVVNAEQAILQGRGHGHIWIRTHRISGHRIALEVADDGPGIAPEIASRVFDPFFTTKPPGIGTGLGLSIVYGIVQEHGGEIYVDSQPGRGARFFVELPVIGEIALTGAEAVGEEPSAQEREAAPARAGTAAEPLRFRRDRILVVEDEPTVAQLIADVLSEERHHVDVALDSREGLNLLARHPYDLIICDLRMPRLDGQAFYRALVRAGRSPAGSGATLPPVLFITGDTLTPRTLEFLEKNELPYLAKPFLVEELKLAVKRVMESARPDAAERSAPGRVG